jgi:hypothetical protein
VLSFLLRKRDAKVKRSCFLKIISAVVVVCREKECDLRFSCSEFADTRSPIHETFAASNLFTLLVETLTACSDESVMRSDRKIVRALAVERNYATCPCGERIKLETKVLPVKVAEDTYRVTHLVAIICPKCRSGMKVDMIAA